MRRVDEGGETRSRLIILEILSLSTTESGEACDTGISIVKDEPTPGSLEPLMVPPRRSSIALQRKSPMPESP